MFNCIHVWSIVPFQLGVIFFFNFCFKWVVDLHHVYISTAVTMIDSCGGKVVIKLEHDVRCRAMFKMLFTCFGGENSVWTAGCMPGSLLV